MQAIQAGQTRRLEPASQPALARRLLYNLVLSTLTVDDLPTNHPSSSLARKLEITTYPDEIKYFDWKHGVPRADIKRLVARWKDGYDWREQEAKLNDELPQFTKDIDVDGFGKLNIHYVHAKSQVLNAIPLLFVHGWPGSFIEVRKILPLLIDPSPDHPSFHVVALDLPAFGFSEAPSKPGFGCVKYAELCHKLMLSLGYNEYVTQGGDWGSHITRHMAHKYGGKHSKAWHTNYPIGPAPTLQSQPLSYLRALLTPSLPREKAIEPRRQYFLSQGKAYSDEQSTKPQTLAYSLQDSPAGCLAWIYEKLMIWSDREGEKGYIWDDDEVLTWVSMYWFARSGPGAASRIYYETEDNGDNDTWTSSTIPMGASFFPKELRYSPRAHIISWANLVFESEHTSGGHFAAHEKPELLVKDLRKMFGRGGVAFGVVTGKDGY
ncbi:alpha/beta-hydrolase [Gymnopus androsaceus JB14]|uniref:Alpha/beta-hydrolase n=1 Tax=Gymnopus androsaceus JB14 TaxID=1447944 RepID=A0A6A4IBN7_9AGAR|nr:alpha/beta-hydrolase [Gymnopus androsaceus JB14]